MYVFEYNGITFVVDFENHLPFLPLRVKTVTFYEAVPNGIEFDKTHKHIGKNTGPLFRTVAEIVKTAMSDWDVIAFTGEQSRVGLYSALGKKFSGSLHVTTFMMPPSGALWVVSKEPINTEQASEISKHAADIIASKT
jgi:hypothetical protein